MIKNLFESQLDKFLEKSILDGSLPDDSREMLSYTKNPLIKRKKSKSKKLTIWNANPVKKKWNLFTKK